MPLDEMFGSRLDRINRELPAKLFITKSAWASVFTKEGKPILLPSSERLPVGNFGYPDSGTDWVSALYNALLKLFFFSASDTCGILRVNSALFETGSRFFNGTYRGVPSGHRSIRGVGIQTGNTVRDYAQTLGDTRAPRTLGANCGMVFSDKDNGAFAASVGNTGKLLWHFAANESLRPSTITSMVGGTLNVFMAAHSGSPTLGLPD